MHNSVSDVSQIANDILESWDITQNEALQLAVQIQRNRIIETAVSGELIKNTLDRLAMKIEKAISELPVLDRKIPVHPHNQRV